MRYYVIGFIGGIKGKVEQQKGEGYAVIRGKIVYLPFIRISPQAFSHSIMDALIDRFKITLLSFFSVRFSCLIDIWDMIVKQFCWKKLFHKNLI